jgi:hypothetical protein
VFQAAFAPETGKDGALVVPIISEDVTIDVLAFSNPIIREK